MLLAYVDESYTTERYYIAALLVPDTEARSLISALDAVATKAGVTYSLPVLAPELHGYELVAAKGDWAPMAPKIRARIGVYNNALAAIANHDVTIILRGVHIERLNRRYAFPEHPHSIVLSHLIERVDELAERRGQTALMIADEVAGQSEYRRSLWEYQRTATRGYRSRQIKQIIDTIHFAPSSSSRLVQAVDLIAYLYRRRDGHVETDERARRANEGLWAQILPKIEHQHCWWP